MLYATSITQAIVAMNPREQRPVLLGIALKPLEDMKQRRQVFDKVVDQLMALW